jgi:hypothetical protein
VSRGDCLCEKDWYAGGNSQQLAADLILGGEKTRIGCVRIEVRVEMTYTREAAGDLVKSAE